jgi:TetR/AcrR family transcriptional regulator, mexCD-oprJ operon repressor
VTDHRRALAERNTASILDAVERLLARGTPLSMLAIAAEAGVSRPTLYARFKSVGQIVEAAVERSVIESMASFTAARPDEGPPLEALERMLDASWNELARYEPLTRGAFDHMSPGAVHRTHDAMIAPLSALVERGRRAGDFRADVPAEWLVSMYFALVHGAEDHARTHGTDRAEALALLKTTASAVFGGC